MKRIISILLLSVLCLTAVSGCSKKTERPFDYDVSKYVEVGTYKGLEYAEKKIEVTDANILATANEALASKGYGEKNETKGYAIKAGDKANIDYKGMKDGVAFEGGTAQGSDLLIGSNTFIDGFESQLIGVKIGDTVNLNLTFPNPYPNNPELAGAAVVFEVKVNYVTTYPELTNDLVAEISDKKTVEEYRTSVVEKLVSEYNEGIETNVKENLMQTIENDSKVLSYPEGELEYAKDIFKNQLNMYANQQIGMTYEQLLSQSGLTWESEEIAAEITSRAELIVKSYLVTAYIAQKENLEVTDEEYEKALSEYATKGGYSSVEAYRQATDEKQFYLMLLDKKVLDFVFDNAVKK